MVAVLFLSLFISFKRGKYRGGRMTAREHGKKAGGESAVVVNVPKIKRLLLDVNMTSLSNPAPSNSLSHTHTHSLTTHLNASPLNQSER